MAPDIIQRLKASAQHQLYLRLLPFTHPSPSNADSLKLQLLTARKKEWRPATADSLPHAVTCQRCDTQSLRQQASNPQPSDCQSDALAVVLPRPPIKILNRLQYLFCDFVSVTCHCKSVRYCEFSKFEKINCNCGLSLHLRITFEANLANRRGFIAKKYVPTWRLSAIFDFNILDFGDTFRYSPTSLPPVCYSIQNFIKI